MNEMHLIIGSIPPISTFSTVDGIHELTPRLADHHPACISTPGTLVSGFASASIGGGRS
ncbi:hypothetical protein SAMN04487917_1186 [Arthrobacter sp. yr096]|uniref:hypothetical protein n=1 Tax=Arthrobacter sp. yr096 TaxID=1761750 RepID=UPI0008D63731|nr:hypothetical protein [Arthrobacter sp. yr096]SEJ82888.1 hypothetical protein SAMN04487917_1186 [Arthrobacter sp. yr096]